MSIANNTISRVCIVIVKPSRNNDFPLKYSKIHYHHEFSGYTWYQTLCTLQLFIWKYSSIDIWIALMQSPHRDTLRIVSLPPDLPPPIGQTMWCTRRTWSYLQSTMTSSSQWPVCCESVGRPTGWLVNSGLFTAFSHELSQKQPKCHEYRSLRNYKWLNGEQCAGASHLV